MVSSTNPFDISSIVKDTTNLSITNSIIPTNNNNTTNAVDSLVKKTQNIVSNFYTFDFSLSKDICAFSIVVSNKVLGADKCYNYIINKFQRSINGCNKLKSLFSDYYITGNCLFGKANNQYNSVIENALKSKSSTNATDTSNINLSNFIVYIENKLLLVYDNYQSFTKSIDNKQYKEEDIYEFKINYKYQLKDYSDNSTTKNDKEKIRHFINLIIHKYLEKMNYIKTEQGHKAIYYKKGLDVNNMIRVKEGIYFVNGFKVSTNFYQNNQILIKTVQKSRLIREQTYLDYYFSLINYYKDIEEFKFNFSKLMKNRCGLAKHTERRVKIDSILYDIDLSNYKFERKVKEKDKEYIHSISLIDYYREKYSIEFKYRIQPLAEQKEIRKTFNSGKTIQLTYFPLELLYILGKLDYENNLDIASVALVGPNEKFNSTHLLMKELKCAINSDFESGKSDIVVSNVYNNNIANKTKLNFKLKNIASNILKMPVIELGNKQLINPNSITGSFEIKNSEPYKNQELKEWLIMLYDIKEHEYNKIYNLLKEAKKKLGLKFEDPNVEIIPSNIDKSIIEKSFIDYFNNLNNLNLSNYKTPEIVLLITSKKKEKVYQYFKNGINNSKLKLRSQVLLKESILRKGITIASNVLLQIWAKRGLPIWRCKDLKINTKLKNTLIGGYTVGYSSKTNKNITSLSISYDTNFIEYLNYCEFHESSNKFSNIIDKLLLKAVLLYKQLNSNKLPKRIILYREGASEKFRKLIIDYEIKIIKKDKELNKIPITIICVHKICDIRFFKQEENCYFDNMNNSNIYNINNKNVNESYISFSENRLYTNINPGSVIESGITVNGNNEYYIVSSYSQHSTCNPTNYVVEYDESKIDKTVLYKLTFDLTFLYYNVSKCIRVPLPLHSASRMISHASNNLTSSSNNEVDYNFGY